MTQAGRACGWIGVVTGQFGRSLRDEQCSRQTGDVRSESEFPQSLFMLFLSFSPSHPPPSTLFYQPVPSMSSVEPSVAFGFTSRLPPAPSVLQGIESIPEAADVVQDRQRWRWRCEIELELGEVRVDHHRILPGRQSQAQNTKTRMRQHDLWGQIRTTLQWVPPHSHSFASLGRAFKA